jgi:hypothetical protein
MRKGKVVGLKFDQAKPDWSLLPLDVMEEAVKVLTAGAKTYGRDNWKLVTPNTRYLSACLRHLTKWQAGEKIDKDSCSPHLAHAICSLVFLLWMDMKKEGQING